VSHTIRSPARPAGASSSAQNETAVDLRGQLRGAARALGLKRHTWVDALREHSETVISFIR
jgi:hypothetical protein